MANKFHHNLRTAREAGMTLLETVISVGLAGVVLVAAANLPIIKKKALATAKSAGQLADLRANVRSTLSCKNTLSGANCNQKSQIIVPKKCDGTPMATESANAEIGNFTIRTSCGTDIGPNRILVEYSPAGKNSWKNLLGGIPLICDPTDATLGPQETVEVLNTNDPNVVTDIYFIVDNSFSMSVIQSKTATAVASLIDKLATFDMSVDLYLYTTTTLPPTLAFQKNSTLGVLDFYGNCNHYCGAKPALEMTNRQFNLFPGGQLVTGDPLNINYGDMVVSVPEYGLAPSQFPGSVLNIRRNMKKSEIDAVKNLAQDTIANLGVDGSDAEAPSAVLEAISEKYTGPSDHRFAALIVTNEDDLTGFVSPTYHYTGYSAAKRLILGHMRVPILSLTNVEYYNGGTYKDGVMVSPAYWAPHPYYAAEIDCSKVDCSGLSTTSEAVCSPEIKEAGKVLLVSTPYLRLSGEPDCKMRTSPSTIPLDGTTTATCDSYGRYSTTLTYREYFRFAYSTRLWDTPDCTIQEVPVRSLGGGGSVSGRPPFSGRRTSAEGTMSKLSETFGARGIKLALIGNDGVTNCGQGTDIRAPTRLKSFLGHSPSPVDFVSICEASYASIADNIKQFVAETPQLEFTLSTNGANVAQVRVKYKDTGSVVLLPQSKYSVSRRKLTLDSGVVQVGDSVMIEYEPDTKTKGDMTIGSTCRK